jgi:predicted enzyme related to lactoylglutathione lyase
MSVKYVQVGMRVRDIEATTQFLEALIGEQALTVDLQGEVITNPFRVVGSPSADVYFDLLPPSAENEEAALTQYCLGVEDVDAAYEAALEAGGTHLAAPTDFEFTPVGDKKQRVKGRAAHVLDPNGLDCELVTYDWIKGL